MRLLSGFVVSKRMAPLAHAAPVPRGTGNEVMTRTHALRTNNDSNARDPGPTRCASTPAPVRQDSRYPSGVEVRSNR
jgi:hypothetical protein